MNSPRQLAKQRGIVLPDVYLNFFWQESQRRSQRFVGSDLIENLSEFNQWAAELLEENNVANFLSQEDFVFMFHQGYLFWFFKANGNPNPMVHGYSEVEKQARPVFRFTEFASSSRTDRCTG